MSTSISISLAGRPGQRAAAFAALVHRLLDGGALVKGTLHTRYWMEGRVPLALPLDVQEMGLLISATLNSDRALQLYIDFRLQSGRTMSFYVCFYGQDYENGLEVTISGRAALVLSLNALARPLQDLQRSATTSGELATASNRVLDEIDAFVFQVCGLADGNPAAAHIMHAAMYLEAGWPSPAGAAMVFHRQAEEFAEDFARIYAEYNWGLLVPVTLERDRPFTYWQGPSAGLPDKRFCDIPGKDNRAFYAQFSTPLGADPFPFLDGLTEGQSRRLAQLPGERIRELLTEMHLPWVRCYDFGDRGLVLSAHPLASVWPAYAYIAECVL